MKKQYMKPEQKVVLLRARHTLLSGSVRSVNGLSDFGGRGTDGTDEDDYGD